MQNIYKNKMEENVVYVLQDMRDNKVIKGYTNEGIFRYWEVNPSNWEESRGQDYYSEDFRIVERVQNGDLKQLN